MPELISTDDDCWWLSFSNILSSVLVALKLPSETKSCFRTKYKLWMKLNPNSLQNRLIVFHTQEGQAEDAGSYFPEVEHFHNCSSNCTSPDSAVIIIPNRIRGKIFVAVQTDKAKDVRQERRSGDRKVPEYQLGENFSVASGCRFSDSVL